MRWQTCIRRWRSLHLHAQLQYIHTATAVSLQTTVTELHWVYKPQWVSVFVFIRESRTDGHILDDRVRVSVFEDSTNSEFTSPPRLSSLFLPPSRFSPFSQHRLQAKYIGITQGVSKRSDGVGLMMKSLKGAVELGVDWKKGRNKSWDHIIGMDNVRVSVLHNKAGSQMLPQAQTNKQNNISAAAELRQSACKSTPSRDGLLVFTAGTVHMLEEHYSECISHYGHMPTQMTNRIKLEYHIVHTPAKAQQSPYETHLNTLNLDRLDLWINLTHQRNDRDLEKTPHLAGMKRDFFKLTLKITRSGPAPNCTHSCQSPKLISYNQDPWNTLLEINENDWE